ncbi:hypothetical protein BC832DRAFT_336553 [Gaertneriomyces semiglobifer]|nr:hypothetical protein BC832DRAFT_336553 [Gaertneriomyces semiglobifer]
MGPHDTLPRQMPLPVRIPLVCSVIHPTDHFCMITTGCCALLSVVAILFFSWAWFREGGNITAPLKVPLLFSTVGRRSGANGGDEGEDDQQRIADFIGTPDRKPIFFTRHQTPIALPIAKVNPPKSSIYNMDVDREMRRLASISAQNTPEPSRTPLRKAASFVSTPAKSVMNRLCPEPETCPLGPVFSQPSTPIAPRRKAFDERLRDSGGNASERSSVTERTPVRANTSVEAIPTRHIEDFLKRPLPGRQAEEEIWDIR